MAKRSCSGRAAARRLGNAVVAPVVPFVPEGRIDPPGGHMKCPGTISVRERTFERFLTDICGSLRAHGFRDVVLVGDSGGNQKGLRAVAATLNSAWAGGKTRVHYVPEYYDHDAVDAWLAGQGIRQVPEGLHDDFAMTATLTAVDPELTRARERQAAGTYRINGVDLAPTAKTAEWGRRVIAFRADTTAAAVRRAVAASPR